MIFIIAAPAKVILAKIIADREAGSIINKRSIFYIEYTNKLNGATTVSRV
jgi:hypothetical protein